MGSSVTGVSREARRLLGNERRLEGVGGVVVRLVLFLLPFHRYLPVALHSPFVESWACLQGGHLASHARRQIRDGISDRNYTLLKLYPRVARSKRGGEGYPKHRQLVSMGATQARWRMYKKRGVPMLQIKTQGEEDKIYRILFLGVSFEERAPFHFSLGH